MAGILKPIEMVTLKAINIASYGGYGPTISLIKLLFQEPVPSLCERLYELGVVSKEIQDSLEIYVVNDAGKKLLTLDSPNC